MSVNTSAVAVGRKFGEALKEARLAARRSDGRPVRQLDVAQALKRGTRDRYSRLERGRAFPEPEEWEIIRSVLAMDEATRARLEALMEAGREIADSWWRDFEEEFPESLLQFVAFEDAAERVTTCAVNVLPSLLQTANYARFLTSRVAGSVLTADAVERSVELRRNRRRIFAKPNPPVVEFIFSEAALRQAVGGKDVMLEQLDSLIEDGALRNVSLRVVPFTAVAPSAYMVHLLEFGGDEKPITAFDSMTGMSFQKRPREVRENRYYVEAMRNLALPHLETIAVIKRIKKEMSSA
ncbi:helix-turn-helix domain-containing protein [Streptomyces sp. NBC_01451]|uniref:helix-turn-helix domain-containing protein n=1 Tax=Streptomyces sp. NBC_01451 TaxID=2903872 RepID=UPI002E30B762|nr:helix-turn-helix transcriptional regulator [Streptomyces sp. NBC_01451]